MISNITIKNIKGYDAVGKSMDVALFPNKINLVIAPNGFGKTSLTTAFEALNANCLAVKDEDKYQENAKLVPFLSITEEDADGIATYCADGERNEIATHFLTHTIHSRLGVYASVKRIGRAIPVTKYMNIQDVEVGKAVEQVSFKSVSKKEKEAFGKKKLLLTRSMDIFYGNLVLQTKLKDFGAAFTAFHAQKNRGALIDECMQYILNFHGTSTALAQNFDPAVFGKIEADEHYANFANLYRMYANADRLQTFIVFHQLMDIYHQDAKAFKKACEYASYLKFRNFIESELCVLNNTWKALKLEERNGKLYVVYPKARSISNGQRDLLTFFVDLLGFNAKMLNESKKGILIIDEIFDYLDDANILVAQYYLTRLLKRHKDNLYIIWLTHLAQENFRSKVLNHKVLNVQYLKPVKAMPNECMKKFIALRQALNKNDATENDLYDKISHYILHYSPTDMDLTEKLRPYDIRGIRISWGRQEEFHTYLIEELNKYLKGEEEYDPYAVAVAVRLKSEVNVYKRLTTQEQRDAFEQTKETKKKFEKMEHDYGFAIPASYFVIAAIHNDADHIYINSSGNIPDASMVYKLEHLVIRNIVKSMFGYTEGMTITKDALR